jgi:hypothetical protein
MHESCDILLADDEFAFGIVLSAARNAVPSLSIFTRDDDPRKSRGIQQANLAGSSIVTSLKSAILVPSQKFAIRKISHVCFQRLTRVSNILDLRLELCDQSCLHCFFSCRGAGPVSGRRGICICFCPCLKLVSALNIIQRTPFYRVLETLSPFLFSNLRRFLIPVPLLECSGE